MKPKGYRVKVTSSGYIYIIITIVLSVGAVNTGNNLLYLMTSLMLALMLLSGLSSLANLFFLDFSITPSQEVFAEIPARFNLTLNKSKGISIFLSCETRFGAAQLTLIQGSLETPLWLKLPKRGKTSIDSFRIHSGFPLGFFRRYKAYSGNLEVLVYTRPIPRIFPSLTGSSRGGEKSSPFYGELGDEVKGLRDYREADPLKWIDWKATARKGDTVVREFYSLEGDTLVIDISKKQSGWERRLSEACYLVLEGHRRKLSTVLILPDRAIGPGQGEKHKKRLLEALSLA